MRTLLFVYRGKKQQRLLLLTSTLLLTGMVGCSRQTIHDAVTVAKEGSLTADDLATIYTTGADQDDNITTITQYRKAQSTVIAANDLKAAMSEPDPVKAKQLRDDADKEKKAAETFQNASDNAQADKKILQSRAEVANGLKSLCDALGKLANYDATGEVKKAANDLLDAASKSFDIKSFTASTPVGTPKDIMDEAIRNIMVARQTSDIRKSAPQLVSVVQLISDMYAADKTALDFANSYYELQSASFVENLLDKKQFTLASTSVFQKFADPYGLQVDSVTDTDTLTQFTKIRIERMRDIRTEVGQHKIDVVVSELKNLLSDTQKLAHGQRLNAAASNQSNAIRQSVVACNIRTNKEH